MDSYKCGLRLPYQDPKTILFNAVLNGDALKVKQLISSWTDKNIVYHSPMKWEGATLLGIAAHEGHLDIVRFLVKSGSSVNFSDPCTGRHSLHWACMGNQYSVVKHLLENGAEVNHTDRENVTPLIHATISQNIDLVQLLIQNGANVNLSDRLLCSPLHYACLCRNSNLVKVIVKSGCVLNNHSSLTKGTPLTNIVVNSDYNNCLLLLEAGYNLNEDSWFQKKKRTDADQMIRTLIKYQSNMKSLKTLCRAAVRKMMTGIRIEGNINTLEIPYDLKSYLQMEDW